MLRRSSRLLGRATQTWNTTLRSLSSMPQVVHDEENRMFYLQIGNDKAVLLYDKLNSVLDLFETEVPSEFRGKGIGELLAKAAFDHVVRNKLKMKVTCTYLQAYLKNHPNPEYLNRVVE